MESITAIAGSGMRAAQQGLQVAAHNVANLATPDAARLQLERTSLADGGVQTRTVVAKGDASSPLADLIGARSQVLAFAANAALIRRSDEMLGSLFDRRI